jgi:hypothetical protein
MSFEEYSFITEEAKKINVGLVKQIVGWTMFAPISLVKTYLQLKAKEKKVEDMIDKESDLEKKAILRQELKDLKFEEVKARERIQKQQHKLDDKISDGFKEMSPEEKEIYKKEVADQKEKLKQAEEEYKITKSQSQGFA